MVVKLTSEQRELASRYVDLVKHMALKIGACGSLDDAISDGYLGLCIAASHFNPELSKFGTYAGHCIVGAIKEGRRKRAFLSRHDAKKLADGEEVPFIVMPLEFIDVPDPSDDYETIEKAELTFENRAKLYKSLKKLTKREKFFIASKINGLTFKEMGNIENISESRACHLWHRAINKLGNYMSDVVIRDGKAFSNPDYSTTLYR